MEAFALFLTIAAVIGTFGSIPSLVRSGLKENNDANMYPIKIHFREKCKEKKIKVLK